MNDTRKQKLTFWLSILVSISTIVYNIVKMWKVFRDDKRAEAEHDIRMCGEHAERLNESLRKLRSFEEQEKKGDLSCNNCKYKNTPSEDLPCKKCKFYDEFEMDE